MCACIRKVRKYYRYSYVGIFVRVYFSIIYLGISDSTHCKSEQVFTHTKLCSFAICTMTWRKVILLMNSEQWTKQLQWNLIYLFRSTAVVAKYSKSSCLGTSKCRYYGDNDSHGSVFTVMLDAPSLEHDEFSCVPETPNLQLRVEACKLRNVIPIQSKTIPKFIVRDWDYIMYILYIYILESLCLSFLSWSIAVVIWGDFATMQLIAPRTISS